MLAELTVKEFLDKVAGSDPVPVSYTHLTQRNGP